MYCEWLPKWLMQWHDVFGNTFYEIYASQNLDRVTIEVLRLSFSEIDLFLWKFPPFCLNGLQNGGYNGMMYSAIRFLKSTPQKTYRVDNDGSTPLSFCFFLLSQFFFSFFIHLRNSHFLQLYTVLSLVDIIISYS